MSDPVFVIHGVANRSEPDFKETVADLQAQVGPDLELKPIYWGDLGAGFDGIEKTIPVWPAPRPAPAKPGTRGGTRSTPETVTDTDAKAVLDALLAGGSSSNVRGQSPDASLALVRDGMLGRVQQASKIRESALRASQPEIDASMTVVREEWGRTSWLKNVDDPDVLRVVGAALADVVEETKPGQARGGLKKTSATVGRRVKALPKRTADAVRRRVHDIDRIVGATMTFVGGRVNTSLRTHIAPSTARFLGDVLVYQGNRTKIHQRILGKMAEVDPRLGRSREWPVQVLAHSLGGVITVDLATAADPLWISALLTFGSQAPLFHVCDPRGGQLRPYERGGLVQLPESLPRWTNLWEPFDILAFIAAKVFLLPGGKSPQDVPVPHLASTGLWTHSAYWESDELAEHVGATFSS